MNIYSYPVKLADFTPDMQPAQYVPESPYDIRVVPWICPCCGEEIDRVDPIVPVLEAEVAAYYEELFPEDTRTKVKGSRSSSGAGYERGKAAGRGINLSRQVGGASSKALGG
jgi:hypothetical protein